MWSYIVFLHSSKSKEFSYMIFLSSSKDNWFPSATFPYSYEYFWTELFVKWTKELLDSLLVYYWELNLTYPSGKTYTFIIWFTKTQTLISNFRFKIKKGLYKYFWIRKQSVFITAGPPGIILINWFPSNTDSFSYSYRFYLHCCCCCICCYRCIMGDLTIS